MTTSSSSAASTVTWVAAAVLIVVAGLIWMNKDKPADEAPIASVPTQAAPSTVPAQPAIPTPVEPDLSMPVDPMPTVETDTPAPVELPPLNQSDTPLREDIALLPANNRQQQALLELVTPREVLRKLVIAVENGAAGKLSLQHPVIQPPGGAVQVRVINEAKEHREYELLQQNYDRFNTYVELLDTVDNQDLLQMLKIYQPLVNEAYAELGVRDHTFNQRLVEMIDVVLATPELETTPILTRQSVQYKFKDPQLEQLPELQKLMIRMGPENAAKVKTKLTALRRSLARDIKPAATQTP